MTRIKSGVIIKHRFHTMNELTTSVKILEEGEVAIGKEILDSGKFRFKIKSGDGVTALKNLPFVKDLTFDEEVTTTEDIFGLPRGTSLYGKDIVTDILTNIVTPYYPVVLNSIASSVTEKEVGIPIDDDISITCNISNSHNLVAGNSGVVSSNPEIFSSTGGDPTTAIQVTGNGYVSNAITGISISCTIQGKGTGSGGETSTAHTTLYVKAPLYYGSFTSKTSLSPADLDNVAMTKVLLSSVTGLFDFPPGRGFFAICNKLIPPKYFTHVDRYAEGEQLGMDMSYQGIIIKNNGSVDLEYKVYYTTYEHNTNFRIKI